MSEHAVGIIRIELPQLDLDRLARVSQEYGFRVAARILAERAARLERDGQDAEAELLGQACEEIEEMAARLFGRGG